jgi:hypothetical protein
MFIATVVVLLKQLQRPFVILRIVVLLMLPFCSVLFIFGFRIHERFVIWVAGMLLVLFSSRRDQPFASTSLLKKPLAS